MDTCWRITHTAVGWCLAAAFAVGYLGGAIAAGLAGRGR